MNPLGQYGEDYAAAWLTRQGYRVLERNWRHGHLEIDLIALDGEDLVFAEVKTRSPDYMVRPAEAVNRTKRRRIAEAAVYYQMEHPDCAGCQPRFDVVELVAERTGTGYRILHRAHWKGACDVNGSG